MCDCCVLFVLCCWCWLCVCTVCCFYFACFCSVWLFGLLFDVLDCAGAGFVFVCCFVLFVACFGVVFLLCDCDLFVCFAFACVCVCLVYGWFCLCFILLVGVGGVAFLCAACFILVCLSCMLFVCLC